MRSWEWIAILIIIVGGIAYTNPNLFPQEIREMIYDAKDKIIEKTTSISNTPESNCKSAILKKYDLEIKKARREVEDYGGSFDFSVVESKTIEDVKNLDDLLYIYGIVNKRPYILERKYIDENVVLGIWQSKTDLSSIFEPTDAFSSVLSRETNYGVEVCDLEGKLRENPLPTPNINIEQKSSVKYVAVIDKNVPQNPEQPPDYDKIKIVPVVELVVSLKNDGRGKANNVTLTYEIMRTYGALNIYAPVEDGRVVVINKTIDSIENGTAFQDSLNISVLDDLWIVGFGYTDEEILGGNTIHHLGGYWAVDITVEYMTERPTESDGSKLKTAHSFERHKADAIREASKSIVNR